MRTRMALGAGVLLLSACASMESSLNAAPRAVSGGTYYCWKDRLAHDGGNLVCNWETSASDACRSNAVVSIPQSALSRGPENAKFCDNGQWLVSVTTR